MLKDEIVVVAGVARYIAGCEFRCPDPRSGGATDKHEAGRGCPDATQKKDICDAMSPTHTRFPVQQIAPPPAFAAAVPARLGVLAEWQDACSSTPPTPRRLGSWSSAATVSTSSISNRRRKN